MKVDGRKFVSPGHREKLRRKSKDGWERARIIAKHWGCTPREARNKIMSLLYFDQGLLELVEQGLPWAVKKAKNLIRGRKAGFTRWYKGAHRRYQEAMKRR